jgi:hypothetical protein
MIVCLIMITRVLLELLVGEVDDISGDGVDERTRVRHTQHRLLPLLQIVLEEREEERKRE